MNKFGEKISKNIKDTMKTKKINQTILAHKLGIANSTLSSWFTNLEENCSTRMDTILKIAAALEVEPDVFFI